MTTQLPPGLLTLANHEARAAQAMDPAAWAYIAGGAGDELTLRANAEAWPALTLWPRVLQPLAGGHTRVRLAGRELAHPILLAPWAHQRLAHPDTSIIARCMTGANQIFHQPHLVDQGLIDAGRIGLRPIA